MYKKKKRYYKKIIHIEEEDSANVFFERKKRSVKAFLPKANLDKRYSIFLGLVLLAVLSISSLFVFIKTHEEFAANFADDTLRPLIGEQGTIQLEAYFFAMQDSLNQAQYKTFHQTEHVAYAQGKTVGGSVDANQNPIFPLDPIRPLIADNTLDGEGQWAPIMSASESGTLIAKTTYRPDVNRPYAVVTLAKLNMTMVQLNSVAGTAQPGGFANPGPGQVPQEIQASNKLVAAFNGGFQQKDGYYGMIVGDKTYLPLEQNMATLVMYNNKTPEILRYTGQKLGENVIAIRQNGPLLIENKQIVTSSNVWNMQTWGLTTTNSMYTWRSGLGVTKEGNIVYAAGPSLVPETLASALLAAGAVNAMQLDINPTWVRFNTFTSVGNGAYDSATLNPAMVDGSYPYLHGYQKDFFYVYKK